MGGNRVGELLTNQIIKQQLTLKLKHLKKMTIQFLMGPHIAIVE